LSKEERALLEESARGASDRALAGQLGFAASTVNIKKHKALEKLRRALLGRRGGDEDEQVERAARSGGGA
jgi:FixJ family two-component response regulator